jgi:hypothetical protein
MLDEGVPAALLCALLLLPVERLLLATLLEGDGMAAWDRAVGERELALLRRELLCAMTSATSSSPASVYIFRKSPRGAMEALVISLSASLSLLAMQARGKGQRKMPEKQKKIKLTRPSPAGGPPPAGC